MCNIGEAFRRKWTCWPGKLYKLSAGMPCKYDRGQLVNIISIITLGPYVVILICSGVMICVMHISLIKCNRVSMFTWNIIWQHMKFYLNWQQLLFIYLPNDTVQIAKQYTPFQEIVSHLNFFLNLFLFLSNYGILKSPQVMWIFMAYGHSH